jgi:hypothetical protein
MAEKTKSRAGQGTFAKLYDVQEELSQRHTKPLGRPRKKIQRKPTTIHLTQSENRKLSQLQILTSEHFSINRSELVGVAVEALSLLMKEKAPNFEIEDDIDDVEGFRQFVFDFIKS